MGVVLLTGDLAVASRVEGVAAKAGLRLKTIDRAGALAAELERERLDAVLIDLSAASIDVGAVMNWVRTTREPRPVVIAFGPHVHESLLAAARAAGCDEVFSRGQFFGQLEAILRGAAAAQGDVGGSGPDVPVSPG
jgi:hypothetical protein